jgi:hypothetical protein
MKNMNNLNKFDCYDKYLQLTGILEASSNIFFYFEIYIKNNNNLERRKTEKSIKRNIMCDLDVIRFWEKTS